MTRLLTKPLKAFAIYALIILLVSIPVYVLVVDYIWVNELDENNWLTIQHTKQRLQVHDLTADEIERINRLWGELQPGLSIEKAETKIAPADSFYEITRPNFYDAEDDADRFRGLRTYVMLNGETYWLIIETNVEEWDETFIAIAVVTLIFFTILILGFVILNRRITAKTWKPFYQTLQSLQSFELSKNQKLLLPSTDILEFQEMNKSLEQLLKNNMDTYEQQKSFTENASHELQTPIALLKSKLDILLQHKDISPEISEILAGIEPALSRLSRINKNLLVLAKVENRQYSENKPLGVQEYILSAQSLFEDYINDKELDVTLAIQANFKIMANPFLLETLIYNLFSNAIRHTPVSGQIHIELKGQTLSFSNSGKAALDITQLFKRFSSTSKDRVSSGLGLAIIKEVALKYNWSIEYYFRNDLHTFSVRF
tara:strand:- start:374 stop:1660 length:1287 start_codon:yes stop_codon:yes gene_type:complete